MDRIKAKMILFIGTSHRDLMILLIWYGNGRMSIEGPISDSPINTVYV